MGILCAYRPCRSRAGRNISHFSFPKDESRCLIWAKACNREDLLEKGFANIGLHKLCEKHFEAKFISKATKKKTLFKQAVPTLFRSLPKRPAKIFVTEDMEKETSPQRSCSIVTLTKWPPQQTEIETHSKENVFLKEDPFIEESVTVKREPDDFDNRTTANEVDGDLDQKSTIKSEEEEENFINSQYVISHEEVDIKSDDDMEQSDNRLKNDNVGEKSEDQMQIHKCPDCPYQSKHKGNVTQHSIRHKKPDEIVWHRCTECPFKTSWKKVLKQHAIVHNETRQIFKCEHCVYETPWKKRLKQHLLVHYGKNCPPMHCPEPECPYKTHNKGNLKRHLVVHNKDQYFKCTQCPYQANRLEYLKRHQLKHESTDTDKWHACPECPYKTIDKNSLKKHIPKHANPDAFEWYMCEQCSYRTVMEYCLKAHVVQVHANPDQSKQT